MTETLQSQEPVATTNRFDSGVLIQRALLTNDLQVSFNGLLGRLNARHGALINQKGSLGWWLGFVTGLNQEKVLQIPDQAVNVTLRGDANDQIDEFRLEDVEGNTVEITLQKRPMSVAEVTMPYQDLISSLAMWTLGGFFKMRPDRYEPFMAPGRGDKPPVTPLEKSPVFRRDNDSADYRTLVQMERRGFSDQEIAKFCRTRMEEILGQLVVQAPWYNAVEMRQVLEAEGHNFEVLWRILNETVQK